MLTKQERAAIAERAKKFDFSDQDVVYEVLVGNEIPDDTTFSTDIKAVRARILDLCDTSNMIELPRDKDGEVIHVGDTVYNENMDKCSVKSIKYVKDNNAYIACFNFFSKGILTYSPNQLTHTFFIDAEQLSKAIKNTVDRFNEQLRELATYMGSLSDSDD